jgi:fructose-1,6-bisphosphatase/inositol monophosphatase family enzyme
VPAGASPEPRLEAAATLALRAGRVLMSFFERATVAWKDDDSMVTDADLAVEDMLSREIAAAFPGDAVCGEGRKARAAAPGARHAWVIDPVDGTNNFGRGMPGFSVSIGVLRDGHPLVGAVHDPLGRQLFTGHVGAGAWLNGRPIRVEPAALGPRSLFSIRVPYPGGVPPYVTDWLERYRLRRPGSTALALCYVATGALAFVHDHRASLWDIAGAAPVVLEAGGLLTDPAGKDLFPRDPRAEAGAPLAFLAGNPVAHQEALQDVEGDA